MIHNRCRKTHEDSHSEILCYHSLELRVTKTKCCTLNVKFIIFIVDQLNIEAVCVIQTDLQHGNSIIYPQIHKNEMSAW